jgi:hypothetical protein
MTPSESAPEIKGTMHYAANVARQMRQGVSFLFVETIKNSLLRLKTAANAALAARRILNVRKGNSLLSSSQQLGCTPPLLPHLPQPRFSLRDNREESKK